MKNSHLLLLLSLVVSVSCWTQKADAQTDVVAFWGFEDNFDFQAELDEQEAAAAPGRFTFDNPDVNNSAGAAILEVFLGDPTELDGNGGAGFVPYTSPVSNDTVGPSRTIRFDDVRGGGDDFSLNGNDGVFQIDENDGLGPLDGDFGNDGLIYIQLDGTGFQDFQIRFDIEATPGLDPLDPTASDLPEGFDIFYRTTGPGGVWFRDSIPDQNNIDLDFFDIVNPPDPDNQVADSGFQTLNAALNNAPLIEIILNDFDNGGNNELEIDNIEIVANVAVPEPTSAGLILAAGLGLVGLRRRR